MKGYGSRGEKTQTDIVRLRVCINNACVENVNKLGSGRFFADSSSGWGLIFRVHAYTQFRPRRNKWALPRYRETITYYNPRLKN